MKDESDIRSVQMGTSYNSIRPAAACMIMRASSEVTQAISSMSASSSQLPLDVVESTTLKRTHPEKIDPTRHKFGIGVKVVTFQYGNWAGRLWMDGAGDRRYARIEPLPGSGVIEFLFWRMKTEIS